MTAIDAVLSGLVQLAIDAAFGVGVVYLGLVIAVALLRWRVRRLRCLLARITAERAAWGDR